MAFGGGNWTYDNKILPGTYVNFSNPSMAGTGDFTRGAVAVPMILNWGAEDEIITLTSDTVENFCLAKLGYKFYEEQMLPLREIFKNADTVYVYRLGSGGEIAENIFAKAKYFGTRGNDIGIVIKESVDKDGYFTVATYLDKLLVDKQEVSSSSELLDNDFVNFIKNSTLTTTACLKLSGGTDGDAITGENYSDFLSKSENYFFDILCLPSDDEDTIDYFIAHTNRRNSETSANFQLVCYNAENPDSENVINIVNKNIKNDDVFGLVYWVSGIEAKAGGYESLTGRVYDGELEIDTKHTQSELKNFIQTGKFAFHTVNGIVRVLRDINSFVSFDSVKSSDFSANQTLRVCFLISNAIANLFNTKYLGKIVNDLDGRNSLWNDICKILEDLQGSRAITQFRSELVKVDCGSDKKSVVCTISDLLVAGAMESLYMNVIVM